MNKRKLAVVELDSGYEGLYLFDKLVNEGNPLNEGNERFLYFIDLLDNYELDISDIHFGFASDLEEFPMFLSEIEGILWEN